MTQNAWFAKTTGGDSIRKAAARSGVANATLTRQLSSAAGALSLDVALAVARAYGAPALVALTENGHLSEDEAGYGDVAAAVRAATDEMLVDEIARRLQVNESRAFDVTLSEVVNLDDRRRPDVAPLAEDQQEAASSSLTEDPDDTDDQY